MYFKNILYRIKYLAICLLGSVLLVTFFIQCAIQKNSLKKTGEEALFSPSERYLITVRDEEQALSLVLNDSPAGNRFLRTSSLPLQINDPALFHLINRMKATVVLQKGVGIAAPQVGINKRLILVKRLDLEPVQFEVYLNPKIEHFSPQKVMGWEGCLSIPAGFGQVERSRDITFSYQKKDGTRATERVEGFVARIFQHEIDHLNGVLFIDHFKGKLIPKEQYKKMKEAGKI